MALARQRRINRMRISAKDMLDYMEQHDPFPYRNFNRASAYLQEWSREYGGFVNENIQLWQIEELLYHLQYYYDRVVQLVRNLRGSTSGSGRKKKR